MRHQVMAWICFAASCSACKRTDAAVYADLKTSKELACDYKEALEDSLTMLRHDVDSIWSNASNRANDTIPKKTPDEVEKMSMDEYKAALRASFARVRRAITAEESLATAQISARQDTLKDSVTLAARRCRLATEALTSWLDSSASR